MKILGNAELFRFCEQFSIILHSGISAFDGLEILCEDSVSEESKAIYHSMIHDMETNGSFSHALKEAGIFPREMVAYVAVGEETGCLDEVMASLAERYEQEYLITQQVRNAVSYPLLMLLMMGVVIVILLTKVLPVFSQVFHHMGMEMNGISKGLLNAGNAMSTYSISFLIIAAILFLTLLFLFFHPEGRQSAKKLTRRIPYLKRIPLTTDYERLSQGISLGLHAGLTPDRSLELARDLISDPRIVTHVDEALQILSEGQGFHTSLTRSGLYTGMDARLIELGYQAGATDEVMKKLSTRYRDESYALISNTVAVIEPVIVILLSLMVGLVLLSVMMPLFGIFTQMSM